jgi:hypothetical protein
VRARELEAGLGAQYTVEHGQGLLAASLVGVQEELREDGHGAQLGEAGGRAVAGGDEVVGRDERSLGGLRRDGFLTRPTSTSQAPGVLEMASTVCRSAEEASSWSTTAALARVARSPWERTETRALREAGDAMQRRESSSSVSGEDVCMFRPPRHPPGAFQKSSPLAGCVRVRRRRPVRLIWRRLRRWPCPGTA